jgi:signal transduction histidine kinase/PAS domain-containing protein
MLAPGGRRSPSSGIDRILTSARRPARAPRRALRFVLVATAAVVVGCLPAAAANAFALADGGPLPHEIVLTSLLVGVVGVAIASAVGMMRARARSDETIRRLAADKSDLRVALDRAEALLDAEDQVLLAWGRPEEPPGLTGSLGAAAGAPGSRAGFLAFGAWLSPGSAADLDRRVAALRERGTPFTLELTTVTGTFVEACGRTGGGRPFVRFRDLTAERVEFARSRETIEGLRDERDTLRALFDGLPMPAWMRDGTGRLVAVNAAYARAVDAGDPASATLQGAELLDSAGRDRLESRRIGGLAVAGRVATVVAGKRCVFDVVEARSATGSAGLAADQSELDRLEAELKRTVAFHARTLDQLTTAVAVFGADRRLQFYNQAYCDLWGLDTVFLEGHPEDAAVLDELRARRRLPEQADWRSWKREMLATYTALESRETWMHLPDGRTLRVVANPHPQGGVIYVYENLTRTLELETQNKALSRVQRETLDHLSEGVAVFGSDGRLRLSNSCLATMWHLEAETLAARPHVTDIVAACRSLHPDPRLWEALKVAVTGLVDSRQHVAGRMERADGTVLDVATVPLPDGATLVTFVNITDTINVERALMEKNEALEESNRIKSDFVGLVSYELRSPLTNVIGFAHLLADPRTGAMNERQQEYFGHIVASSQALMAIVDDILDLATIDAGTMKLQLQPVDVAATVAEAIEGVQDRISSAGIHVVTEIDADLGMVSADQRRLRQILFNLLSNALRFSRSGGEIRVTARRERAAFVLVVADQGVGIPVEQVKSVFDRFFARPQGAMRGGAGLGLSLVKSFVELHGGRVRIDSVEGVGTTVTCVLPLDPAAGLVDVLAPADEGSDAAE